MKELDTPELRQLNGYQEAMGDVMVGNLSAWFESRVFDVSGPPFKVEELVKAEYPGSDPSNAKIIENSIDGMIASLDYGFSGYKTLCNGKLRPRDT